MPVALQNPFRRPRKRNHTILGSDYRHFKETAEPMRESSVQRTMERGRQVLAVLLGHEERAPEETGEGELRSTVRQRDRLNHGSSGNYIKWGGPHVSRSSISFIGEALKGLYASLATEEPRKAPIHPLTREGSPVRCIIVSDRQ